MSIGNNFEEIKNSQIECLCWISTINHNSEFLDE